jgi:hypothetical protein
VGVLQTPYNNPAMSDPGDQGDLISARGGDPLIDTGGASGLKDFWSQDQIVETPGGMETSNSVSSMPNHPDRFQPTETPPEPPSLEDRSPGTIDQR